MTFFQKICLGIQLLRGVYIGKYPPPLLGKVEYQPMSNGRKNLERGWRKREKCLGKRRKDKGEIKVNGVKQM
jgi:hypothetical protein